ncbi:pyridoxal phosphate-dependent decarboxylase family protein [Halobacillus sp. H74]|uniref:pyridoxal phosphate-dependent decarboxylase family protein n=1 Tax=Halobacillus sp. H74 TaxID=3457436 RepID=UPI003FCC606D
MISSIQKNSIGIEASKFDAFFLHQGKEGLEAFREQIDLVTEKLEKVFREADGPYTGQPPMELKQSLEEKLKIWNNPRPLNDVLEEWEPTILKNSLQVSHTKSIAHLHCPPILPGIAAELIIAALNQSMDSWDQSPAATYVEAELIRQLSRLVGLPASSDGVFTSGGTQSNYMGLLLARDAFCEKQWNHDVQAYGLPGEMKQMKVLCSEEAHFSVKKSISQLGLGEEAVIPIPSDENHRMNLQHVKETFTQLEEDGSLPFAVVATCGTTDYGSIDPMEDLAELCRERNLWLHIDAAYGGGLVFSHEYKRKIAGLHQADSITLDFHKLGFQPISCGLFLLKDRQHYRLLSHHADYLNPEEDEEEGILNLVNKSVQTTRRFDALKMLLTLNTVGTDLLGKMVDQTMELAEYAASVLEEKSAFAVENHEPELTTVVFQYRPLRSENVSDWNRKIQQILFQEGKAAIAKTSVNGETYLKFTILNPRTSKEDIDKVIQEIERAGTEMLNGGYQK